MEQNGEHDNVNGGNNNNREEQEQEEALVALVHHRKCEVQTFTQKIAFYTSQLEEAGKKLKDAESKLARLRGQPDAVSGSSSLERGTKSVKTERMSNSPIHRNGGSSKNQLQPKQELHVPPKNSPAKLLSGSSGKATVNSNSQASPSVSTHSVSGARVKPIESQRLPTKKEDVKIKEKGTKRKFEQKEHKELIPLIRTNSSPSLIHCQTSTQISSQHKRKLRSLALCPVNDQLFVTSSLDGVVNLWQVQARGSGASLLSSTNCSSSKQNRWPEDITWHPDGSSLFAVYSADGGDSQISVLDLNKKQGNRVNYLEERPHVKGIINNIAFMPWENACFVTGGSDHAVMLWSEKDGENKWKPKALHRNLHSSAVMGVAGLQQKHVVLSVGADRRIIGYDAHVGRADYRHQVDSKCMSVLPNPCDFNLFVVQTGTPERQLRLYDIRLRQTELHAFGWKQESSESQSALINQAWSPDGLYLTSGSADPMIHIFDIRYNSHKPPQSIKAHQKRVFKAVWLSSIPLLISISSDLNIEQHKIM